MGTHSDFLHTDRKSLIQQQVVRGSSCSIVQSWSRLALRPCSSCWARFVWSAVTMRAGHDDVREALLASRSCTRRAELLHSGVPAAASLFTRFQVDKLFCYSASTASDVVVLLAFKWVQTLPHLLCMVVSVVGLSPPLILSISAACQVESESESVKPETVQRLDRCRSHIGQGIPDDTCAGSQLPAVSHICERPLLLAESCRSVSGAESAPSGSDRSLVSSAQLHCGDSQLQTLDRALPAQRKHLC